MISEKCIAEAECKLFEVKSYGYTVLDRQRIADWCDSVNFSIGVRRDVQQFYADMATKRGWDDRKLSYVQVANGMILIHLTSAKSRALGK